MAFCYLLVRKHCLWGKIHKKRNTFLSWNIHKNYMIQGLQCHIAIKSLYLFYCSYFCHSFVLRMLLGATILLKSSVTLIFCNFNRMIHLLVEIYFLWTVKVIPKIDINIVSFNVKSFSLCTKLHIIITLWLTRVDRLFLNKIQLNKIYQI